MVFQLKIVREKSSATTEGVNAEVYLQFFNFYNRRNEWFVEYDPEDSSKKPKVAHMLPVLPTLGFDFRF